MQDTITKQTLTRDLKALLKDAETVLRETKDHLGDKLNEKASAARARLEESIENAREKIAELEEGVKDQAKAADEYVREHPWQSAGVALGVGLILGLLISRSSR